MATNIKGPGILWVLGNISTFPDNPLTESAFIDWYDNDHISEVVETSGIKNAFRTLHVDKTSPYGTAECPKPFMAFYAMKDLAFTQGEEFRKIKVKSDLLPGTGICYDMADLDVGYYGLVGKSGEGRSDEKGREVKFFASSAIEPAEGVGDEEVNAFFDQQTAVVAKLDKYLHSRRFRLQYARTNAQSRALKGLPATTDQPVPEPPTWLVIHSFSAQPASDVREAMKNDTHEVLKKAKQNQTNAYKLDKAQGKGRIFDDVEDGVPQ